MTSQPPRLWPLLTISLISLSPLWPAYSQASVALYLALLQGSLHLTLAALQPLLRLQPMGFQLAVTACVLATLISALQLLLAVYALPLANATAYCTPIVWAYGLLLVPVARQCRCPLSLGHAGLLASIQGALGLGLAGLYALLPTGLSHAVQAHPFVLYWLLACLFMVYPLLKYTPEQSHKTQ